MTTLFSIEKWVLIHLLENVSKYTNGKNVNIIFCERNY